MAQQNLGKHIPNKPTQQPTTTNRPGHGDTHIRGEISEGPSYRIPTPPPKSTNK